MGKKIAVSLSIILICSITFINGYTYVYPSFADSTTDQWTSVTTTDELVDAFRYYCKSRSLIIDGSVADAVTSFTTKSFTNICNTLGINITALQADLKRSTDKNGGAQYLFNTSGISTYNRIFAEFLQNHDLAAGDEVPETQVQSGEIFTDADGYSCEVYVLNTTKSNTLKDSNGNYVVNKGTKYRYTGSDLRSLYKANNNDDVNVTFHLTQNLYWGCRVSRTYNSAQYAYEYRLNNINNGGAYSSYGIVCYASSSDDAVWVNGKVAICKLANGKYYLCTIFDIGQGGYSNGYCAQIKEVVDPTTQSNDVYIYSPTTINNNTYNDNRQTVINNEGDVYNYNYDDKDPPVNAPPSTVTPPSDSGGSDGDVSFPDFNFQLPEIDWSLGDLSEKFPFSIPFDLIAFFTVLNAEPQAPSIDANIPLGSWYTWHFQADFSQFDNWATIVRNVEFIAFCIGLIYLTIRLVKG